MSFRPSSTFVPSAYSNSYGGPEFSTTNSNPLVPTYAEAPPPPSGKELRRSQRSERRGLRKKHKAARLRARADRVASGYRGERPGEERQGEQPGILYNPDPGVPTTTMAMASAPELSEEDKKKQKMLLLVGGGAALLGLLLVGPFVVTPWIVKQFKPEWSYGKRVATGFVVSFGVGALTGIARAAGGKGD